MRELDGVDPLISRQRFAASSCGKGAVENLRVALVACARDEELHGAGIPTVG
jgi:hypothetical protein